MAWFTASMGSSNKEMGNHQFAIGALIGARPEQLLILLSRNHFGDGLRSSNKWDRQDYR
jgi:hypothetical protein